MAKIKFLNNFDGQPMSSVQANIKEVTLTKPIDDTTAGIFYDAANSSYQSTKSQLIGLTPSGITFAVSEAVLASMLPNPLTISDLTVTGNTILGDNAAQDTITLNGKVIGSISAAEANETINTLTANTINVSTLNIKNAVGSYVPYRPFFPSTAAPTNRNIFWLDTTNSAAPIIKYCTNPDVSLDASWVSLGAVFG